MTSARTLGVILALTLMLGGCFDQSSKQEWDIEPEGAPSTFGVPQQIQQKVEIANVIARVMLDGVGQGDMEINGDIGRIRLSNIAPGTHTIVVHFYYNDGGTLVSLAQALKNINIIAGQTAKLTILESDYVFTDSDNDGISNADEIDQGTDYNDRNDPAPQTPSSSVADSSSSAVSTISNSSADESSVAASEMPVSSADSSSSVASEISSSTQVSTSSDGNNIPTPVFTVNAGDDVDANEGDLVALKAQVANAAGPVTYLWTTSASNVTLQGAATDTLRVQLGNFAQPQALTFNVSATAGGQTLNDDVVVNVAAINEPPVVTFASTTLNAAPNALIELAPIPVADPESQPLTYGWEPLLTNPVEVVLTVDGDSASFTAPALSSADEILTLVFVFTASDGVNTPEQRITVTVQDNNDAPVARISTIGDISTVAENSSLVLSGLTSSDIYTAVENLEYQWKLETPFAYDLGITDWQTPTLTVSAPNLASDVTLQFSLVVKDDSMPALSSPKAFRDITIEAVNNPAVLTLGRSAGSAESGEQGIGLTASAADPDLDQADATYTFEWVNPVGFDVLNATSGGAVTFDAPSTLTQDTDLTFTVNATQLGADALPMDSDTISVRIGGFAPPQAVAALANAMLVPTEAAAFDVTAAASLNGTNPIVTYQWATDCDGTLTNASAVVATFTPNNRAANDDCTLTVEVSDGTAEGTDSDTLVVSIQATDEAPTLAPLATINTIANAPVSLDASGAKDPEGTPLTFNWTTTSGVVITGATTAMASFVAPDSDEAQTLAFTVTISDGNPTNTLTRNVTVAVAANNSAPIAVITPLANDRVAEKTPVVVRGDASNDAHTASDALIYQWAQLSPTASEFDLGISDWQSATLNFTSPNLAVDQAVTFGLIVTDAQGLPSAQDTYTLTLGGVNDAPTVVVNASQNAVSAGAIVTLTATASNSDIDQQAVGYTYAWTAPAGFESLLSGLSAAELASHQISFTAPTNLSADSTPLAFTVTATEDIVDGLTSDAAQTTVTVGQGYAPPVAGIALIGGGSTITEGVAATFSAASSQLGTSAPVTYQWTTTCLGQFDATDGVEVNFTGSNLAASVDCSVTVTIDDGAGSAAIPVAATLPITLSAMNDAPIIVAPANALQDGVAGTPYILNATGLVSDKDSALNELQIKWAAPDFPQIIITPDANEAGVATVLVPTNLFAERSVVNFVLSVSDGNTEIFSQPNDFFAFFEAINESPIANITDANGSVLTAVDVLETEYGAEPNTFILDGSLSNDDFSTNLHYQWQLKSTDLMLVDFGINVADLVNAKLTVSAPNLLADTEAIWQLVVEDEQGNKSLPSEVVVTVIANNDAPVAIAGISQNGIAIDTAEFTVSAGDTILMNGNLSFDGDDGLASVEWSIIDNGGASNLAFFDTPTGVVRGLPIPSVPNGARAVLQVTAEDNSGQTDSDTLVINILPSDSEDPAIQSISAPSRVTEGDQGIQITVNATDDSAIATYLWSSPDPEVQLVIDNTASAKFDVIGLPADGDITLEVLVTDVAGKTANRSVNILVERRYVPWEFTLTANPEKPDEEDGFFTVNVVPTVEGTEPTLTYNWSGSRCTLDADQSSMPVVVPIVDETNAISSDPSLIVNLPTFAYRDFYCEISVVVDDGVGALVTIDPWRVDITADNDAPYIVPAYLNEGAAIAIPAEGLIVKAGEVITFDRSLSGDTDTVRFSTPWVWNVSGDPENRFVINNPTSEQPTLIVPRVAEGIEVSVNLSINGVSANAPLIIKPLPIPEPPVFVIGDQTIPSDGTYVHEIFVGDPDFEIRAQGGQGTGEIVYSFELDSESLSQHVATIDEETGKITLGGRAGELTVLATKKGDFNYQNVSISYRLKVISYSGSTENLEGIPFSSGQDFLEPTGYIDLSSFDHIVDEGSLLTANDQIFINSYFPAFLRAYDGSAPLTGDSIPLGHIDLATANTQFRVISQDGGSVAISSTPQSLSIYSVENNALLPTPKEVVLGGLCNPFNNYSGENFYLFNIPSSPNICMIDVNDPASLQVIGLEQDVSKVFLIEEQGLLYGSSGLLKVWDIFDLSNPTLLYETEGGNVVAAQNGFAYTVGTNSSPIRVFDAFGSNDSIYDETRSDIRSSGLDPMKIVNNKLFFDRKDIVVYDLRDPSNLRRAGFFDLPPLKLFEHSKNFTVGYDDIEKHVEQFATNLDLDMGANYTRVMPGDILTYDISWDADADIVGAKNPAKEIRVYVSGGFYDIEKVDFQARTARVRWVAPLGNDDQNPEGHYEIKVYVGNQSFYISNFDWIKVDVESRSAQTPFTLNIPPSTMAVGQMLSLGAFGGESTGDFIYISSDESVAQIDSLSGVVNFVGDGGVLLTVVKSGDENFSPVLTSFEISVQTPLAAVITRAPDSIFDASFAFPISADVQNAGDSTFIWTANHSAIAFNNQGSLSNASMSIDSSILDGIAQGKEVGRSIKLSLLADGKEVATHSMRIVLPFVTQWDTGATTGVTVLGDGTFNASARTGDQGLIIGTNSELDYNYLIDWGDGQHDSMVLGDASHEYLSSGLKTVKIIGVFPHLKQSYVDSGGELPGAEGVKLISVLRWGDIEWQSMRQFCSLCMNLERIETIDSPDLSLVTDMSGMFFFAGKFNSDISGWDVSNVVSMNRMFGAANSFNQSLNNWNVSAVKDMNFMFGNAINFDGDISDWDTHSVTDMSSMFIGAVKFNQNLGGWDTRLVQDMSYMFSGAVAFNQPLNAWETASVKKMNGMFNNAESFNQDISGWNTSSVEDMSVMFSGAISFNQPIGTWNTSSATYMYRMFESDIQFDQDLSAWNIESVGIPGETFTGMREMFAGAKLSTHNYDLLLIEWSKQNVLSNNTFDAGGSQYSLAAATARQSLIDRGWVVIDGGLAVSVPDLAFVGDSFNISLSGGNSGVVFESEDLSVATVDVASGQVTLLQEGIAQVRVSDLMGNSVVIEIPSKRYSGPQLNSVAEFTATGSFSFLSTQMPAFATATPSITGDDNYLYVNARGDKVLDVFQVGVLGLFDTHSQIFLEAIANDFPTLTSPMLKVNDDLLIGAQGGLGRIDVSDVNFPQPLPPIKWGTITRLIGNLNFDSNNFIYKSTLTNDYIGVVNKDATSLGSVVVGRDNSAILKGDTVFVAMSGTYINPQVGSVPLGTSLKSYRFSAGSGMEAVGELKLDDSLSPQILEVIDGVAYMSGASLGVAGGLQIISVSNPANMSIISSYYDQLPKVNHDNFKVYDGNGYFLSDGKFYVLNMSDSFSPFIQSVYDLSFDERLINGLFHIASSGPILVGDGIGYSGIYPADLRITDEQDKRGRDGDLVGRIYSVGWSENPISELSCNTTDGGSCSVSVDISSKTAQVTWNFSPFASGHHEILISGGSSVYTGAIRSRVDLNN